MKYLLIMGTDPDAPAAPEEAYQSLDAWAEEMEQRGVFTGSGSRLRPAEEARTVRVRDGEVLWTHGPYAELAEQIAGYDQIQAADLDEAIEIAAKHPAAQLGAIEIRPLWVE